MSIGATFRKCDFQIHTPVTLTGRGQGLPGIEQIKNEDSGLQYTQEEVDIARRQWASDFVDKCLKKELKAVAITDHHEMVMTAYVRDEIEERIKAGNDPDLWLFPGMELTLKGGVQCLILFDRDLELGQWNGIQTALKINIGAVDQHNSKGAKVEQIDLDFEKIEDDLNRFEPARGRFIILPNVSQGGQHTVALKGKHKAFLQMPYVGGYLDNCKNENDLNVGHKKKLFGKTSAWGSRVIYPLPTSDCREHNYPTLGKNNSWIKLAEPTAEAIRQAFLSHKSRISIDEPELPSARITSLTINGSSVLKDKLVSFNPELNTIIGGRGTGKSTLHEYLCFALGRSNKDLHSRNHESRERLIALIDETVVSLSGGVQVTFLLDGAEFTVSRSPDNCFTPVLTYPDGTNVEIDSEKLREHFPGFVLSQGELSEIGRMRSHDEHLQGLLQFVQSNYRTEARELLKAIESNRRNVQSAFLSALDYWQIEDERNNAERQRKAIGARIAALQKSIPQLSESEQNSISRYARLSDEGKKISSMIEGVSDLDVTFTKIISDHSAKATLEVDEPPETLSKVRAEYNRIVRSVIEGVTQLQQNLEKDMGSLGESNKAWEAELAKLKKQRDTIMEKVGVKKNVSEQIDNLQQQSSELVSKIEGLSERLRKMDEPTKLLESSRQKLFSAVSERKKKLSMWCAEIEKSSEKLVHAVVSSEQDWEEILQALTVFVDGTGSKSEYRHLQFADLCDKYGLEPLLEKIYGEAVLLIRSKLYPSTLPPDQSVETPILDRLVAKSPSVLEELKQRLDGERVSQMLAAVPSPKVSFLYTADGVELEFGKASEGQRAAALLTLLLHQKGGPLIIDQPEGDLDNKIISDIADILHSSKTNRQIIMVTHNANLVVNGSAELVHCMENADDGERDVKHSGAIDKDDVKDVITYVMEGGKTAFKDRQVKYGF